MRHHAFIPAVPYLLSMGDRLHYLGGPVQLFRLYNAYYLFGTADILLAVPHIYIIFAVPYILLSGTADILLAVPHIYLICAVTYILLSGTADILLAVPHIYIIFAVPYILLSGTAD